jgi:hypothetical protein
MGVVVNKSFNKVRKDIDKKAWKLLIYLQDNICQLDGDWTSDQNDIYMKLGQLSFSLEVEIAKLEAIRNVPEFK